MIRVDVGMATSRFTRLCAVPERSYRRWQQRTRSGLPARGPWPTPAQDRVEEKLVEVADRWPAWGHRKIAQITRTDGTPVSDSTALRALKRNGRVLSPDYTRERRDLAAARRSWWRLGDRIRCGNWTSPNTKQVGVAPGGSRGAPTTGRKPNWVGTYR